MEEDTMHRSTSVRVALGTAVLTTAAIGAVVTAQPASAKPDTSCLRAGIATLQGAGLLDDVARDGLPIATAVGLGVLPRAGTDVSTLPDPLPLKVVLADHRAGQDSLFVYPWC
jgi:hypothetical protein